MCGRFLMDEQALAFVKEKVYVPDFLEIPLGLVFPGKPALVIKNGPAGPEGDIREFGMEKDKKRIFNARSETVLQRPMFGRAVRSDRCLIPAARFYEWDPEKTMVTFWEKSDPCMYLAGFYEGKDFVILTTEANGSVAPWHARMPLVLPYAQGLQWLEAGDAWRPLLKYHPGPLENDGPLTLF